MVDWSDPKEIEKDSGELFGTFRRSCVYCWNLDVFLKLIFALFGVYTWELFMTWDFEWSLLSGRRKFRWPLVCVSILSFVPYLISC
jgi:hypothetical protein